MTTESTPLPQPAKSYMNTTIFNPLGPIGRYNLSYASLLTLVPFLCGVVLMLLLLVFSKLNLYFLETNGLVIDEQIRDAYYSQVQGEIIGMGGYMVLQLVVTAIVSIVVMRWASAPFVSAARTIETAVNTPENLRPANRFLSESPFFDRVVWLFALRVKNGGQNQMKETSRFSANLFFLVKFCVAFTVLSVITGYFMGITIGTVYDRVISLALDLVRAKNLSNSEHFFTAQQEILSNATTITTAVSMIIYLIIGLRISRYMTTMIFVFARALEEDRFPVQLRTGDVYHHLASLLNRAREKIR